MFHSCKVKRIRNRTLQIKYVKIRYSARQKKFKTQGLAKKKKDIRNIFSWHIYTHA